MNRSGIKQATRATKAQNQQTPRQAREGQAGRDKAERIMAEKDRTCLKHVLYTCSRNGQICLHNLHVACESLGPYSPMHAHSLVFVDSSLQPGRRNISLPTFLRLTTRRLQLLSFFLPLICHEKAVAERQLHQGLPGEVAGKSSNTQWAFREVSCSCTRHAGVRASCLSCDAVDMEALRRYGTSLSKRDLFCA